jgi:peptidoglycan hydrolase-like protein with peptidoglycan-binding domain
MGQLERSSLSGFPSDSFAAPAASPMPAEALGSSPSPSARKKPAASTSLKPTTREIQQALQNAGFYQGAVDGKLGPITRESIKEFQRVHGLTDDGLVGKQTWAKLKAYADLPATSGELNAAETLK